MFYIPKVGKTTILATLTGLSLVSISLPKSAISQEVVSFETSEECATFQQQENLSEDTLISQETLAAEVETIPVSASPEAFCDQLPEIEPEAVANEQINRGNENLDAMFFEE